MSTVRLKCNHCPAERQGKPGMTIQALRKLLVAVGWASDNARDVDVCGECLARARQPKRFRPDERGGAS